MTDYFVQHKTAFEIAKQIFDGIKPPAESRASNVSPENPGPVVYMPVDKFA